MILDKQIMLQLINKYENSKSFVTDSQRPISLKASELKGYQDSAEEKAKYHYAIKHLEALEFLHVEWIAYEENNLLKRLILNLDALNSIYTRYDYDSKTSRLERALNDLDYLGDDDYTRQLKVDIQTSLNKGKFHKYWPDDQQKRTDLILVFKGLKEIDEMTERLFSLKYFKDSKYFEKKVKARVLSIIKAYQNLDLEDHEILEGLGIMQNPNEILICGHLQIKLDQWIDFSKFLYGGSLNQVSINNLNGLSLDANRIITIENKAVYYEYIKSKKEEELVIYLGGFFGKSTRLFLSRLSPLIKDLEFYHWSDIDLGGFRIFDYLNGLIDIQVQPYNMTVEDLKNHRSYCQTFEKTYEKKLVSYIQKNPSSIFKETVLFMLENKVKLEQEVFYI